MLYCSQRRTRSISLRTICRYFVRNWNPSLDGGVPRGWWRDGGIRLSATASGREGRGPERDDGVCLTTVTGPWVRKREESAVKRLPDLSGAAERRMEPAHHHPLGTAPALHEKQKRTDSNEPVLSFNPRSDYFFLGSAATFLAARFMVVSYMTGVPIRMDA